MIQDADVRSYFVENVSKKSVNGKEEWEQIIETLLQNGVETMREFGEKDDRWFYRVFTDEDWRSDKSRYDMVRKIRDKYFTHVRKADLLAAGEDLTEIYITEHAPAEMKSVTYRTILAVRRARIETMSALCVLSVEELKRIRNMGVKSVELALLMREKYTAEKDLPAMYTTTDGYETGANGARKE